MNKARMRNLSLLAVSIADSITHNLARSHNAPYARGVLPQDQEAVILAGGPFPLDLDPLDPRV